MSDPSRLNTKAPAPAGRPFRWKSFFIKAGFLLVLCLILLEVALRVQQKAGPYYDLDLAFLDQVNYSDELNHVPSPTSKEWDEHGLKVYGNLIPDDVKQNPKAKKILFQGDSFMQGFPGKDDIAWQVWSHFQAAGLPMVPLNAGYSSYAVCIYTAQAKKLIPVLKPDHVIVVIDNTDMPDDNYRYADVTRRDGQGRIEKVTYNPEMDLQTKGYQAVRSHWLYTARLLHKIYFTRLSPDRHVLKEREQRVIDFTIADGATASAKYQAEVALFEKNLNNLADVLIEKLGSAEKAMWVCHPHPQHLHSGAGEKGHHRLVFESVEKIAKAKGIVYYDATADLRTAFGEKYVDYYMKNDPYYHFTPAGLAIYSKCIFEHVPAGWKK